MGINFHILRVFSIAAGMTVSGFGLSDVQLLNSERASAMQVRVALFLLTKYNLPI
jgi:hypothetical protein